MRDDQKPPVGEGWGDPISAERKAELDSLIERWEAETEHGDRVGPLAGIHLTGADIFWLAARFRAERSPLRLEGANLSLADLADADLTGAHLEGAVLVAAQLQRADLQGSYLQRCVLGDAHLTHAYLRGAHLEHAVLHAAHLEHADLSDAHLDGADLSEARLEGANLTDAHLDRANCTAASFDKASRLNRAHLDGTVLDQAIFDNTNLAVVQWDLVETLGDEQRARAADEGGKVEGYRAAARAYRALAVALRNQGLARDATRFHYRSELMDRTSLFFDGRTHLRARQPLEALWAYVRWLASWALGTFAGYGDYIGRLFLTYAAVVLTFALLMFLAWQPPHTLDTARTALVLSITSFHGRGLQPTNMAPFDTLAALAALESIFGLLIEGLFIAAFTRRVIGS